MPAATFDEILADLAAEYERLDAILAPLGDDDWATPSAAAGWTIADVVAHLALSEEFVALTLGAPEAGWNDRDATIDAVMDDQVRGEALSGPAAFARWRAATSAAIAALRRADPEIRVRWAAAPLKPGTLATTRLAEHWAHGLDIAAPLGVAFDDTDRLRDVAWLGHSTLPYAMATAGLDPRPVRADLVGRAATRGTSGRPTRRR
jgi:uncharacterized protein (TIGR03084 family)